MICPVTSFFKIRVIALGVGFFSLFFCSFFLSSLCFAEAHTAALDGYCYALDLTSSVHSRMECPDDTLIFAVEDAKVNNGVVTWPASTTSGCIMQVQTKQRIMALKAGAPPGFTAILTMYGAENFRGLLGTVLPADTPVYVWGSYWLELRDTCEPPPTCAGLEAAFLVTCQFGQGSYDCATLTGKCASNPCDPTEDNDGDGFHQCSDCDDGNSTINTQCIVDQQHGCPEE